MTVPSPRSRKCGSTARQPLAVPKKLVRITSSNTSCGVSSKRPKAITPALFTQTSIPPNTSMARSANRFICSWSRTSVGTTMARPPASMQSSATSCRAAWRRAARTTAAPWRANSSAVARPIPLDAPVMTTTLSKCRPAISVAPALFVRIRFPG